MEIRYVDAGASKIAEVVSDGVVVSSYDEALDLIATASYNGAEAVVLRYENLIPDFFELRTGIAGEILQKFTQYDMKLAIIGDFTNVASRSLRDFIRESNRQGRIAFVGSVSEAMRKLGIISDSCN